MYGSRMNCSGSTVASLVGCARPAALLVLHDQPPDLPVGLHHGRVDGAAGTSTRRLQNGADLPVQRLG